MSEVPKISQEQIDKLAGETVSGLFGDPNSSRGQIFLDPKIPVTCYDIAPNAKLEERALSEGGLFPLDLVECIVHKANGCGVSPMTMLRQHVAYALSTGQINNEPFDLSSMLPVDAKELSAIKRKPADDAKEPSTIDQLIKMFLKDPSTCYQLWSQAKANGISNQAALCLLVDAIVDGKVLRDLIADSKEAMKSLNEMKKKKHLFQEAMGHIG